MSDRLPASLLVAALLRQASEAGGFGAVLARGDPDGGAVLVVALDRGGSARLLERGFGGIVESIPADDVDGYWRRRRAHDPDLWVVELDVADSERLAASILSGG